MDRRLVLMVLDSVGIRTPNRLISQSEHDIPALSDSLIKSVKKKLGLDMSPSSFPVVQVIQVDVDTIRIGDLYLKKPFVEKPVSGEDHNIHIYYHSSQGGGLRRLFRKASAMRLHRVKALA